MTELARGTVVDRPWGRTLGALGARNLSGQLTVIADGKPYRIAFRDGAVVGATSPLASDAAVRLALTGGLVTSTQVADITRRIAAAPARDEVDVLAEAIKLAPDHAVKLRRRLVAQRAARTFALEQGDFVIHDSIDAPVVPGSELDVRAVIYLGARTNLTHDRLAAQVSALGAWFKLKPEVVSVLAQFGFTDADKPVLQLLLAGAGVDELVAAAGGEANVHGARAIVYALASCNACDIEAQPRAAMPQRSRDVTARASVESIAGRRPSAPPPTVARSLTPTVPRDPPPTAAPAAARTPTPTAAPIAGRTPTPTGPYPLREPTPTGPYPLREPTPTGPFAQRAPTPTGPVPPRTATPTAGPATARTPTQPPRATSAPPTSPRSPTVPPAVGRTSTRPPAPNNDFAPSSLDRTPGLATARTATGQHGAATDRTRRNTSAARETEAIIRDRVALLDRGADFFVLLGISRDASPDVTRAAYFTLARKLHPDRLASLGIADTARDAQRLFAQINAAFATLNDPAKRAEYVAVLARGGESAVRAEEAKADETAMRAMHAEEAFRRGEMALRREQLEQALTEFTTAVELQPEPEYHAMLAWTKFAAAKDKPAIASETRGKLTRAAEQNEQSPIARFYLGRVERILGREQAALQHFQEVLRIKPNHAEASAEIRVLEARLKKR